MSRFSLVLLALFLASGLAASTASAEHNSCSGTLKIMLTNDDGFDSPGITAMQAALVAAGHEVTIVAPLEQQSGKGGSISTDVGGFIDIALESAPGDPVVWSVASTPSDATRMGLSVILADDPPDLVVSGSNFGQNLGQGGTRGSGTLGAALAAAAFGEHGIPAIAMSVGIDFAEAGTGFPSTFAAFGPAGEFTADVIEELQQNGCRNGQLLPRRHSLNINFPVPFEGQQGVKVDRQLGETADLDLVFQDVQGAVAAGGGGVLLNVDFPDEPDAQRRSDTVAFKDGFVTIATMDGDMSARRFQQNQVARRLRDLAQH